MSDWPAPRSIAVYIHWPFCAKKCPYCDFAVTVRREADRDATTDILLANITDLAKHYPTNGQQRPRVHSIYFGGGTPSLMDPAHVDALIGLVSRTFGLTPTCEITLEANPTDAETAKFQDFRDAGVNRLSLGVQSLDDIELMVLGRNHNGDEARRALDVTARVFDNFSLDLIYALPQQKTDNWAARVDQLLAWNPSHISLYQLTIEAGTVFEKAVDRGILKPFRDDPAADLYLATSDQLAAAGYPAYEVSNHAKPGFESRHNLSYWRYDDYIGVGTGAHGRLTVGGVKYATEYPRTFQEWAKMHPPSMRPLPPLEAQEEAFLMSMRTHEGAIIGDQLSINTDKLSFLIQQEMLVADGNRFRPTREGWLRLDTITGMLLT